MLVPTLFVRNIDEAVEFLTRVVDFELVSTMPEETPFYAVLTRDEDELHLSLPAGPRVPGTGATIVVCKDADALFVEFIARGLQIPINSGSPVHEGPLDQTWGTREFCVDDPSGNTLVFQQRR